ncbi:diguanylate cyclase [Bermanella marisrubri]|uniref:Sensory box protein n=1 Tax=Bermanella marisrubri TaxID=207949 RepID=Q1N3N5_9GAMM|nr:GGDEF and EAL domain-containing protein [Bermanella marisrubri]EAT12839.1 sensory box protein [Oceanobacter sp. RED65] [Bermanella marisrubri]QIZ83160.1 diguanylate cyclase [Bermanella marisrubri]
MTSLRPWQYDLMEQSPQPCAVRGEGDDIVYINPAFTLVFGYTLDEVRNINTWYRCAYPDESYRRSVLQDWEQQLRQLEQTNSHPVHLEVTIQCKNGEKKRVELYPFKLNDGQHCQYGINFIDVTRARKAEDAVKKSEERHRLAMKSSGTRIWDWDVKQQKFYFSPDLVEELGYDGQRLEYNVDDFYNIVHPDDLKAIEKAIRQHFKYNTPYHLNYRLRHKDGHYFLYENIGQAIRNQDNLVQRFIGSSKNLSTQKALNEQAQFGRLVFDNSGEGILIADAHRVIKAVNSAYCYISGYEQHEVIGLESDFLLKENPLDEKQRDIFKSIQRNGYWRGETWYKHKEGHAIAIEMMINTQKNSNNEIENYIVLFSDITDKKQTQELIWQQAHYDNLTQLLNRHSFTQYTQNLIQKALPFALLFIDLDNFKQVNDTQGHNVGDALLIEAAKRIKQCVRESDIVARFGGDEFTVLLLGIKNVLSTKRICSDITKRLSEPFTLDKEKAYVSASIGIAQFPWDSDNLEDLYKYADQAMYEAKHLGRNRFSFFTHELQQKASERQRISLDLRQALERNEFQVYYQPIVDLKSHQVHKAEALIRWHHPRDGIISPADFIPIAEESGLIIEIGNWIFKQAAMQTKLWRKTLYPDFQISINKSPVQFYGNQEDIHQSWSQFLQIINLPGDGISVEITEGLLLDSIPIVKEKLSDFSQSGIQVSLDDFGTGYSALSYLKKFNIDYIKIDMSFVRNIVNDKYDLILCETIIAWHINSV